MQVGPVIIINAGNRSIFFCYDKKDNLLQFIQMCFFESGSYILLQIDRLKKRYDAWQAASKKSGSVLYFEPLKLELNDCFGALKDVTPDLVYSNLEGASAGPSTQSDVVTCENANGNNEPTPSTSKKRKHKSRIWFIKYL